MGQTSPVKVYASRRMAALTGVGFAAGLPYVLAGDTLSAWLSGVQIDVKSIGLFSLIGLPYALKFLWAPLMDRFVPPGLGRLGRRRGWLLLLQATLAVALMGLAAFGPQSAVDSLAVFAALGTAVIVLSASQDIVADAYRVDVLEPRELGAGAAVFVTGYRLAMIVGGAFVLILAPRIGWQASYAIMAGLMMLAALVTLWAPEPPGYQTGPRTLSEAVTQPVGQFARSRGWVALFIVVFVLVFRLPDLLAARMTMPLLIQELEFSPAEVGTIRQMLGFFLTIIGALLGGAIIARRGLLQSLLVFGILQTVSNAGFLALAMSEPNLMLMGIVIAIESLCGGLVAAGFVAFLMSCCDRRYSATQYALLTALMAAGQALGGAFTGYAVEQFGYAQFFLLTIVIGVPGLLMIPWVREGVVVPEAGAATDAIEAPA